MLQVIVVCFYLYFPQALLCGVLLADIYLFYIRLGTVSTLLLETLLRMPRYTK